LREKLPVRASADVGAKKMCKIKYILWWWWTCMYFCKRFDSRFESSSVPNLQSLQT